MNGIPKHGRIWRRVAWTLSSAALVTVAISCENTLKVTNPQNLDSAVLDNPLILQAVVDGVEGTLQQAFGNYVIFAGLMSDELEDSSTWINYANMSLGRFGPSFLNDQNTQNTLLQMRYAAGDAEARITRVLGAAGATSTIMAQAQTSDAWTDLYNAMMYCESPLVSNGPSVPDSAVYKQALSKFNTAITTAQGAPAGAPTTAILNWARAGRARTNLFLGNWDAATADAAAVPAGYVKLALFSTNSATSGAGNQLNQAHNKSGTLRRIWWPMVDTSNVSITPTPDQYITDPWTGQNDPRMAVLHTKGNKGVSNQILYYSIEKYKDYQASITMTGKAEMNLIQAEVYWRKGDLPNAVASLNIDRQAAGLPAFAMPLKSADVFNRLLSERFAQMFVEGMRMTDLNRFNLVTQQLGTGRALKFQMSYSEIIGNPSLTLGKQTCPAMSQ